MDFVTLRVKHYRKCLLLFFVFFCFTLFNIFFRKTNRIYKRYSFVGYNLYPSSLRAVHSVRGLCCEKRTNSSRPPR